MKIEILLECLIVLMLEYWRSQITQTIRQSSIHSSILWAFGCLPLEPCSEGGLVGEAEIRGYFLDSELANAELSQNINITDITHQYLLKKTLTTFNRK